MHPSRSESLKCTPTKKYTLHKKVGKKIERVRKKKRLLDPLALFVIENPIIFNCHSSPILLQQVQGRSIKYYQAFSSLRVALLWNSHTLVLDDTNFYTYHTAGFCEFLPLASYTYNLDFYRPWIFSMSPARISRTCASFISWKQAVPLPQ